MSHRDPETSERPQLGCDDAVELLPWLLNGSLEAAEERAVREHLAGCERCRAELGETAEAWDLLTGHVPSLALAEYALGVPLEGGRRELYERHFAGCPACRQELEGVMADRVVDFATERSRRAPEAPARRRQGAARRHRWAIAASVAALLGVGGWLSTHLDRAVLQSPGEVAAAAGNPGAAAGAEVRGAPRAEPGEAPATALLSDGFESGRLAAWSTPESEEPTHQPSRRRI